MTALTDLPSEILCEIMRVAGQPARVQSMLACKSLSSAAGSPGVWESVTFADLDDTAVDFMLKHRCATVTVISVTPDDVAWFLHKLADTGCGDCIADLRLEIGMVQRLPEDLLCAVGRHAGLQHFAMTVDDMDQGCEICFSRSAQLLDLRTLSIVERSAEVKQLAVWFDGSQSRFPQLRSLELEVALSDVLAGACHMPHLRRLVYRADDDEGGETYEDACLTGCELDHLELDVGADSDMRYLCRQISKAAVRRLVLHVTDDFLDLSRPLSTELEDLVISMCTTQAEIELDFLALLAHKRLKRLELRLGAPWITADPAVAAGCEHTLVFRHVPAVRDWVDLMGRRVELKLAPTTRACISPV